MSLTSSDLQRLLNAAATQKETTIDLVQRICAVPSPTGQERRRAEFVAELWRERGYTPEIDEIGNVYVRRVGKVSTSQLMLLAHTDTVFPLTTPITIQRSGDLLYGPGIGDNSIGVAALLSLVEMLDALHWSTATDLMLVANVGEEGLGNLAGARAAVERHRAVLGAVIVVDGRLGCIVNGAVGSQRWRVTVRGPGGHAFGSFGTPSAIHGLAKIVAAIADIEVPKEPRTTFNVGVIEGGNSVNSIAAEASALLDLRSTDPETLKSLAAQLRECITQQPGPGTGLSVEIELLGERPAGQRPIADPLVQLAARSLSWLGLEPRYMTSSTDANISISMAIPTVAIGITLGEKAHTRNEYIQLALISKGLAQLLRLSIEASELIKRS